MVGGSKGFGSVAKSIPASAAAVSYGRGLTSSVVGLASATVRYGRGSSAMSRGRASSSIAVDLTVAGWLQMSLYNPLVSSGSLFEGTQPGFWQRDLKSAGSTITILVAIDRGVVGGETVTWASDGDAVEGVHWTTSSAKTVTLKAGQRLFEVSITPKETGAWYRERTTKLRLTGTGVKIDDERSFVHLVFNSSVLPPSVALTSSASGSSSASSITFTVTASYVPQDSIVLYAELDSNTELSNYIISGLGQVVIAAGTDPPTGTFTASKIVGSGGTGDLSVSLVYERGVVAFVEQDYDTSLNTFTVDRNAYLDQNLWHQSNDISSLRFNDPGSDPIRPLTPGHPCSHEGGGAVSYNTLDGEAMGIPQDAETKLLDPVTGNDLMLFHPNYNVTSGMSYLREGFDVSYGGGAITAHDLKPYVMVRWYFKEMVGVDASRNSEFRHVRVRVRNSDRNHGVTFRFGNKIATDHADYKKRMDDSAANFFVFASGLVCWEYSKYNGHELSNDGWGTWYGAGEDSNGTYLWFQHHTNSDQSYATTAVGSEGVHGGSDTGSLSDKAWWIITPGKSYPTDAAPAVPVYREYSTEDTAVDSQGVASGNPIEYPIWTHSGDGSSGVQTDGGTTFTNRINYIRANRIGCLVHSMQFSMHVERMDPPNATTGRFWPCEKSGWDPRGCAVIAYDHENFNMLGYTTDLNASPGMDGDPTDSNGSYFYTNTGTIPSTGPASPHHPNSTELTWHAAGQGGAQIYFRNHPITWKANSYQMFSFYAKKPATDSAPRIVAVLWDVSAPNNYANNQTFDWVGDVLTVGNNYGRTITTATVEDAGGGWYRASIAVESLGSDSSLTADGDGAWCILRSDNAVTGALGRCYFSAFQFEQHVSTFTTRNLLYPNHVFPVGSGQPPAPRYWSMVSQPTEQERVVKTTPYNTQGVVWEAINQDHLSNAVDGGGISPRFDIDNTKRYRVSIWIRKQYTSTPGAGWSEGAVSFLIRGFDSSGANGALKYILSSTVANSGYFNIEADAYMPSQGTDIDDWYLYVGYVEPHDFVGNTQDPTRGIYSRDGATHVVRGNCFKWTTDSAQSYFSFYTLYNSNSVYGDKVDYFGPRYEVVDGTEPTIAELRAGTGTYAPTAYKAQVALPATQEHIRTVDIV